MSKTDDQTMEVTGKVIEALPNTKFRVLLDNGHSVLAHLNGRLKKNFIKVIPGDQVDVQISAYDISVGRICRRK